MDASDQADAREDQVRERYEELTGLPYLPLNEAPNLRPRSDAEARWQGGVTRENFRHIGQRVQALLDGRAFCIVREYSYRLEQGEPEITPVARLREDVTVRPDVAEVQFATADWHYAIPRGAEVRLERDRVSWRNALPGGDSWYRCTLVRLEDDRDLNVMLEPEEAAAAYSGMVGDIATVSDVEGPQREVMRHVERVLGDDKDAITRWLPR